MADSVVKSVQVKPSACKGCPLYEEGIGPLDPQMPKQFDAETQTSTACKPAHIIVTDKPEPEDVTYNAPLQGSFGRLFRVWMREAGIRTSKCFITHAVKCYADGKRPSEKTVLHCARAFLDAELVQFRGANIIVAGDLSSRAVLGVPLQASMGYMNKRDGGGLVVAVPTAADMIKNPKQTGTTRRIILNMFESDVVEPALKFRIVSKPSELAEYVEMTKDSDVFVFDTETVGLVEKRMLAMGIADKWGRTISFAWNPVMAAIVAPLFKTKALKIAYNAKFDGHVLTENNVQFDGVLVDLMRLVQLDDIPVARMKLENVAPMYLKIAPWKRKADTEGILTYNAKDAFYEWRVYTEVMMSLAGTRREELFKRTLELDHVVFEMERRGFMIDVPLLQSKHTDVKKAEQDAMIRWICLAGDVNPNSPKQLIQFFGTLGIKLWKTSKGKDSTGERYLKLMRARLPDSAVTHREVIDALLELRTIRKQLTTYFGDKLITAIRPDTNTLHCNINVTGTISGRFSFSNPNLGNIPKDKDVYRFRDLFIARPGYTLISSDWSQAEMRVTAILSKEKSMLDAWAAGKDVHTMVASRLYNIPVDKVTKAQRSLAKRIVYGLSYGSGATKLAEVAEISFKSAQALLNKFKQEFPNYFGGLSTWGDLAMSDGFLVNPFGRVHNFYGDRIFTQSRNFMPQSTVADMMNVVLCRIYRRIQGMPIHILLQVYDQVILEAQNSVLDTAIKIVSEEMNVAWPELNGHVIPADVTHGARWGEL